MSPDLQTPDRVTEQAAQWFTRMTQTSLSNDDLWAFRAWRRDPANAAAYAEIERLWSGSEHLRSDPQIQAALDGARQRNRPSWFRSFKLWLGPILALGGVALAMACGVVILRPALFGARVYETAIGEQSTIALEDGSHVRLDTNSRIAVRYTARQRSIALVQGQAFFDVVHRADRPLSVTVGDTQIKDLGTRFDVRRDLGAVRVTVVEGEVQVGGATKTPAWTLKAGQQVVAGQGAPYPVDPVNVTSWTSGRLVFANMPLASVAAEMNRYGAHKLILRVGAIGDIKVNGSFDSTDTAAFVAAVTKLYQLKAQTQPDGSILLTDSTFDRAS